MMERVSACIPILGEPAGSRRKDETLVVGQFPATALIRH